MSQDGFRGGRGRGRGGGGEGRGRGGFRGSRGGSGDRGGSRGRGGDRGSSRGFRGGDRGSPRGFRGGDRGGGFSRGGRGGDRGGGGGFRGGSDRGGFRGGSDRGGFRGGSDRGSFRGGDRGSFRGGDRGAFRGGDKIVRGGRGGGAGQGFKPKKDKVVARFAEIKEGLQLYVVYKNTPTLEASKELMPGFHSRWTRPTGQDDGSQAHILLFTDVESMESAKVKLATDDNVTNVDYLGIRSAKRKPGCISTRQIFIKFDAQKNEASVKELDSRIVGCELINGAQCALIELKSTDEAKEVHATLSKKVGKDGIIVVKESFGMKYQIEAQAGIERDKVVLRDVPKTATLKDIAAVFPDALDYQLFEKTFPDSKYCHAIVRFAHLKVAQDLIDEPKDLQIAGKKVFLYPCHRSMETNDTALGKPIPEKVLAAKAIKDAGPPSKKMKLEKEDDDEDDDDDDEEEDEDAEDEEGDDDEDEEGEEEEGDEDEGDDDEEEDAENGDDQDDDDDSDGSSL